MLEYDGFGFASPPRTGTAWFVNACALAGLGEKSRALSHTPPPQIYSGVVVCIIRHPLDWLVSYYMALTGGSIGVTCVDQFVPAAKSCDTVERFLKHVAYKMPGSVGSMFKGYRATTMFKLEDLPYSALDFLIPLSRRVDRDRIMCEGRMNARNGRGILHREMWYKLITESEKEFCKEFDYF